MPVTAAKEQLRGMFYCFAETQFPSLVSIPGDR